MRSFLVALGCALALTACESEQDKAARLSQDKAVACLDAQYHAEHRDTSVLSSSAKCDAATAAYNRFLNGR